MLRATQLQPHMRHGLTEHRGLLQLAAGEQSVQRFRVRPGLTLELTLAQFWNSLGSSQLSVQVRPMQPYRHLMHALGQLGWPVLCESGMPGCRAPGGFAHSVRSRPSLMQSR